MKVIFGNIRKAYNEFPRLFWVVVLTRFIDSLGSTILFPFFSLYVTQKFGVGMTQETRDMLFGKMNSSSLMGTNKEKGSGLGLLLVKDFIAQHGGQIEVESELDKGTCFRFTMPKI